MRGAGTGSPILASAREVWKGKVLCSCMLALPETDAPHLCVSSGGVEVDGTVFVRASLTGMVGLPTLPETVAKKHRFEETTLLMCCHHLAEKKG